MDVSEIRDRIVDVQVMRLGEVEDHPLNYKIHTDLQGAAMDGVVEEVGWAGIPLAYHSERNGGKLTYLDGHLRKRRFPNLKARVAITDLNDQEADLFLLTYDPIAAMAHESPEQLDALLRNVEASNAAVQALLAELASKAGLYIDKPEPPSLDDLEAEYGEPDERDFWPVISVKVSPETKGKYDEVMKQLPGEDEAAKFDALISGAL